MWWSLAPPNDDDDDVGDYYDVKLTETSKQMRFQWTFQWNRSSLCPLIGHLNSFNNNNDDDNSPDLVCFNSLCSKDQKEAAAHCYVTNLIKRNTLAAIGAANATPLPLLARLKATRGNFCGLERSQRSDRRAAHNK